MSYGSYIGITELILVLLILFLYFGSYSWITKCILVLRNLYLRYRANSSILDTEVPVGTIEHFAGTKVPIGTTERIHHTDVPVGTTGLILILVFLILYLSYRAYTYLTDLILTLQNMYLSYRSYTCFTDTGLPVGTTELILLLLIREYP